MILSALALLVGIVAAPVNAQISADLAKKCRAEMIKAHPTELFSSTGSEAAQRVYFQKCIDQGQQQQSQIPESAPSTTGQQN